jgi:alpha-beta hydrolase superfamily lysophospholipase
LGVDFVGTLQPLQSLEKDIVHGMGIAEVPRRYRELLENLIEEVQAVAKPRSRGEGNAGESSPFGAVPRRA